MILRHMTSGNHWSTPTAYDWEERLRPETGCPWPAFSCAPGQQVCHVKTIRNSKVIQREENKAQTIHNYLGETALGKHFKWTHDYEFLNSCIDWDVSAVT